MKQLERYTKAELVRGLRVLMNLRKLPPGPRIPTPEEFMEALYGPVTEEDE